MECPRCSQPMTEESLEGHLGRPIVIDICSGCQSLWFDSQESLRLSPASTLRLFRLIGEQAAAGRPSGGESGACPRCGLRLRLTRDMQRATRFEYLSCPRGHGRLTTFFNFLREKNFITPLSARQIADLRANVQTVNCSNCGAPIDLAAGTVCAHCASPLSMLDLHQAEQLVVQLREADRTGRPVDPALPLQLERTRRDVHGAFDAFEREDTWYQDVSAMGLVGAGLGAVSRWLKRHG